MNVDADFQSRVDSFYWHHSIDLGRGVVTRGGKTPAICSTESNLVFDRIDLSGRSVLDIGAWSGFFSFEAKRRGAGRVLATDSYCWSHPHIRGREAFDIAREALEVALEAREIDAADMSPDTVGEFDVVLYLGVFYHRYDAVEVLAKIARLAKHVLVLETHLDVRDVNIPAMAFYPGRELNDDPTNWWGPNEHCIKALLLGLGFTEIEISAHPVGYNRAIFHAWRSTELRKEPLPETLRLKPYPQGKLEEYRDRHPLLGTIRLLAHQFTRLLKFQ
jgi:tRNA (mo5U34)-methyltransferase